MGEKEITVVIEERAIIIKFDITGKLSDLRQLLINEKYIIIDPEGDTWRFTKVKNGKVTATAHTDEEQYLPVSTYIYDDSKICVGNLKKSLEVFADTIHEFFRFDVSDTLRDLRNFLIGKKFINADEETSAWRFLSPSAKDLKDVTEAIMGLETEEQLPVKNLLYGSSKVRLVNTGRKKSPDLIGVGVDYLNSKDGDIEVRVLRNNSLSADKLAPILLKNVRPANKHGVRVDFDNVVLCEKETSIGFRISTNKHGGFAYSIIPQEGGAIVDTLYSQYTGMTTWAYKRTNRAIEVVSYKDLDIPTQQAIGHRRLTVNVWRYISVTKNGRKHVVDDNAPKMRMATYSGGTDVISGDSTESGAFHEGKEIDNGMGSADEIIDDRNEVLGTFEIDFLVFKTKEDAQNMVESRIDPVFE